MASRVVRRCCLTAASDIGENRTGMREEVKGPLEKFIGASCSLLETHATPRGSTKNPYFPRLLMNSITSIWLITPTILSASTTIATWSVSKIRSSSSIRALG